MHDIFDESLTEAAKARGITRLDATWITKPGQTKQGLFTIVRSTDQSFFKSGVSMVADLELDERRDNVHHRSSGLDSTSAKLCAQHGVLVGINLANLRTLDPIVMGRVMQNIRLCRQHKATMAVFSNAKVEGDLMNLPDVLALLHELGMASDEAKRAVTALEKVKK